MKPKTSLYMLGTLSAAVGAAFTTYLATKPQLRKQMGEAKTTREALHMLGKHMRRDGGELSSEISDYLQRGELPNRMRKAGKQLAKRFEDTAAEAKDRAVTAKEKTAARLREQSN